MKQYHRYRMDFESKWVRWSGTCVGAAMFLLAIQYLWLQDLTAPGALFWDLWVPIGLGLCYTVLLRGIRLNAPGIYAILGVLMCIWLLAGVFSAGNVLRSVLGTIAYLFSAAVLILCAGGFLPGRLPAAVCFGVILAVRVLFFDLGRISGEAWLAELTDLGFIASLICLPMAMVPGKKKE